MTSSNNKNTLTSNWQDILKQQHDEIDRLEALDQAMDQNIPIINSNISHILKQSSYIPPAVKAGNNNMF